jgi:CheY-like chemotaxis protein
VRQRRFKGSLKTIQLVFGGIRLSWLFVCSSCGMKMTETSNELPTQTQAERGEPLCLWLVDDHESVLNLAAELIGKDDRLDCARKFHSAEAVLDALTRYPAPDIILSDVNMGGMTGINSIAPIKRISPETRVFIMTTFYDSVQVSAARREGAAGFFLKSGDWDEAIDRLANPSADWEDEQPVPVPVQWEMEEADFEPVVRGGSDTRPNSAASGSNRIETIAAQEDHPPLLARAVALARAFLNRQACPQRPNPQ